MKNNKGITLIALIVTIIAIIILASVSINLLLGKDGIITKSKQAKINYQIASNEEYDMLANFDENLDEILAGKPKVKYKTIIKSNTDNEVEIVVFPTIGNQFNYEKIINNEASLSKEEEKALIDELVRITILATKETNKFGGTGESFSTVEELKNILIENAEKAGIEGLELDGLNTIDEIVEVSVKKFMDNWKKKNESQYCLVIAENFNIIYKNLQVNITPNRSDIEEIKLTKFYIPTPGTYNIDATSDWIGNIEGTTITIGNDE